MRRSGGNNRRRRAARLLAAWVLFSLTALVTATAGRSAGATSTVVSLTFDNGNASQYSLGYIQALQPHGVPATFYVNSGTVQASAKYLSWLQLSSLVAAGNEVGGKTVDGANLTSLTTQQQVSEVCGDRQALLSHGLSPFTFAYPAGAFTTSTESVAQSCGYANARTAGSLSATGPAYAETLPPKVWLAVRAFAPTGQISLSGLESLVSGAAAHGGGWLPIVIQKVCSQTLDAANYATCTSSAGWVDLADLNAFLDWLQAAGQPGSAPAGTVVKTVGAVAAPADTSTPSTTMMCNGAACGASTYPGTVTVTLAATDTGSGVASTRFTTDGSTPTLSSKTYSSPFPLTSSTTVQFRSWDNAGNAEAVHSQVVSVQQGPDSTAPSTTIACNGAPCRAGPYVGPVTVTLLAADNPGGWGVANTYYTTDGTTPSTASPVYTGPFVVKRPTTVQYLSTDLAGNVEPAHSQPIQIQTIVSLTFDDAYLDQWLYARPLLRSHHLNATIYVITADSDVPYSCCMSWDQLRTMQSEGDDVGSHTIDHPNLTTLSAAQVTNEVCGSRQDMINNGIVNPVSFAYPFGSYNSTVEQLVQSCGFTNSRQGGGLSLSTSTPGPPYVETVPPRDAQAIRTVAVDGSSPITLSDLEAFVSAAAQGGGWIPITFHDVCDQNASDYANCMSTFGPIDDTILAQFLDWLTNAGQNGGAPTGVVVKTMADTMNVAN